jgi:effector-binding domain-containing protein
MQTDFKIRDRGPATVMSRRTTVRLTTIGTAISGGFAEIYGYLGPRGAASGEPFVVYHGAPGEGDRPFDIEICAPVVGSLEPPAGWQLTTLPAGTFASVLHLGSYDTLGTAYDELESWIAREDFAVAGPPREVYLSEPSTPPEATRTVIEFPVVASTAALPATVS